MKTNFRKFANKVTDVAGSPAAFGVSVLSVIIWGATGHYFHYSETWQLVINTSTTIITFLMVFLIQNTQNRESKIIQMKLDEIIKAINEADNEKIFLDDFDDGELDKLHQVFKDKLKK